MCFYLLNSFLIQMNELIFIFYNAGAATADLREARWDRTQGIIIIIIIVIIIIYINMQTTQPFLH
eukprot:COSAG06_NODE_2540_length_6706_cov_9.446647_4_plen_65_part_00